MARGGEKANEFQLHIGSVTQLLIEFRCGFGHSWMCLFYVCSFSDYISVLFFLVHDFFITVLSCGVFFSRLID